MRSFYYFIVFLVLMISIYYFSASQYRTGIVSLVNLISILFLLSNDKKIKSIFYPIFLVILFGEITFFSYDILSGFNIRNVFEFLRNAQLTETIYEFKGSKVFDIDTNLYAPLFAILSIIFKQFNRKLLAIISFILLFLTFSRSAILITFIILLFPEKKIDLKYLYIFFAIAMFFFLNYQGDNLSINLKISTYLLFFKSFASLGPIQFLLGSSNIDKEIEDELLIKLGGVSQGHTLPGAIFTYGLIYIFSSMVIFFILWRKNENMRLPIIFLVTYSLFSVTSFSIPTPLLIVSSVFRKNTKDKINFKN